MPYGQGSAGMPGDAAAVLYKGFKCDRKGVLRQRPQQTPARVRPGVGVTEGVGRGENVAWVRVYRLDLTL